MNNEAAHAPRAPHMRRLEPAAIGGVMSREVANFRTFWKATTFSSVLEPVVYLLAFGLGLGATIVNKVEGLEYVEFVGTGMVATAVIFSTVAATATPKPAKPSAVTMQKIGTSSRPGDGSSPKAIVTRSGKVP